MITELDNQVLDDMRKLLAYQDLKIQAKQCLTEFKRLTNDTDSCIYGELIKLTEKDIQALSSQITNILFNLIIKNQ